MASARRSGSARAQAAGSRCGRPRRVAAHLVSADADHQLVVARPRVGVAAAMGQHVGAVGLLEARVHLEAAVVRRHGVRDRVPGALVRVDAHEPVDDRPAVRVGGRGSAEAPVPSPRIGTRSARVTAWRSAWPWRGSGSAARRALRSACLRVHRISLRREPTGRSVVVAGAGSASPASATADAGDRWSGCEAAAAGSAAAAARTHAAAVMRAGRTTAGFVPDLGARKPQSVCRSAEIAA